MYYMIDNYDSFVYNLVSYMQEAGHQVCVRRADRVRIEEIQKMNPEGILLSPGPKTPADARETLEVLKKFQGKIPILGVCLGHQVIGHFYGAVVEKGKKPMHGKITSVFHEEHPLFKAIPNVFEVTRYHSLEVKKNHLPDVLKVIAESEDGSVMAISHTEYPIYGVQYHPEAVLTEYGHELLENFHDICKKWREYHD